MLQACKRTYEKGDERARHSNDNDPPLALFPLHKGDRGLSAHVTVGPVCVRVRVCVCVSLRVRACVCVRVQFARTPRR